MGGGGGGGRCRSVGAHRSMVEVLEEESPYGRGEGIATATDATAANAAAATAAVIVVVVGGCCAGGVARADRLQQVRDHADRIGGLCGGAPLSILPLPANDFTRIR